MITVSLPEDLRRQLESEVAAGRAISVEAAVERAVRVHLAALSDLRRSLDEAEAEYDEKGGIPWEDVRAHIHARLAADD
jgi:Arc/MetJ-type ribon-helix-helix transcriptional regulator